jgi:hypothetical protein
MQLLRYNLHCLKLIRCNTYVQFYRYNRVTTHLRALPNNVELPEPPRGYLAHLSPINLQSVVSWRHCQPRLAGQAALQPVSSRCIAVSFAACGGLPSCSWQHIATLGNCKQQAAAVKPQQMSACIAFAAAAAAPARSAATATAAVCSNHATSALMQLLLLPPNYWT